MTSFPEENFYRVAHLVLDIIPAQLRNYFRDKWDTKNPLNPWDDTGNSGRLFLLRENNIKDKGVLGDIEKGDTSEWDGTTLFAVLLYSSHNLLQADENARTCINDLRGLRNTCYRHLDSGKIDDSHYQQVFHCAKNAFALMGWSVTGINATEARVLVTQDYQKLKDELRKERANDTQLEIKLDTANGKVVEVKQIAENLLREKREGKVSRNN